MNMTYLISGIYINFRRILCKSDVGYYVINHEIVLYSFNFIITQNS